MGICLPHMGFVVCISLPFPGLLLPTPAGGLQVCLTPLCVFALPTLFLLASYLRVLVEFVWPVLGPFSGLLILMWVFSRSSPGRRWTWGPTPSSSLEVRILFCHLDFDQGAKVMQHLKGILFTRSCWNNGLSIRKNMNFDLYLI